MNEETCKYESQPNYEAEYYRQLERNCRLERENDELREIMLGICKILIKENGSDRCNGKWIREYLGHGEYYYKCSHCSAKVGRSYVEDFGHKNFCPDCGARMDKE